jgi:hypothetical protein
MGVAFELGKLAAVAWLGQRRGATPLRLALVVEADLGPVRYLATLIDYLDRATLRDQQ